MKRRPARTGPDRTALAGADAAGGGAGTDQVSGSVTGVAAAPALPTAAAPAPSKINQSRDRHAISLHETALVPLALLSSGGAGVSCDWAYELPAPRVGTGRI